ncbi:MAG: 1-deoxy-D-xylulose-5-phosphate reductoisomerase [Bacilli bacterium]
MKKILILGASGSIGQQSIDVISSCNDFVISGISVGKHTRIISSLIKRFPSIEHIYMISSRSKKYYESKYPNIVFTSKKDDISSIVKQCDYDMLINALVGFVGLKPTIEALKRNKVVLLANKESLVVGGELINSLLKSGKGQLFPIDSEHSAITKCLSVSKENVKRIILTASGGPFKNLTREQLKEVTKEQALNHPTWSMGKKITIDSATMMNKCFEVIEAHYLFDYPFRKIGIIIHDESLCHSLVEYNNHTYRADIDKPDMRIPIKYALYLGNIDFNTYTFKDFSSLKGLTFHPFSIERFPVINYAKLVIKRKGTSGAILNACNEVAVKAFLENKIKFYQIEQIIDKVIKTSKIKNTIDYFELEKADKFIRKKTNKIIKEMEG